MFKLFLKFFVTLFSILKHEIICWTGWTTRMTVAKSPTLHVKKVNFVKVKTPALIEKSWLRICLLPGLISTCCNGEVAYNMCRERRLPWIQFLAGNIWNLNFVRGSLLKLVVKNDKTLRSE